MVLLSLWLLQDKQDNITSSACQEEVFYYQLMEVTDFRNDVILAEACRTDVEKYCKDVEPGEGLFLGVWWHLVGNVEQWASLATAAVAASLGVVGCAEVLEGRQMGMRCWQSFPPTVVLAGVAAGSPRWGCAVCARAPSDRRTVLRQCS